MDLYILNKDRELIDIIDNAESVIWTNRYNTPGDFEIYIRVTHRVIESLAIGNFVTRVDDDMVGIIEKIELTTDVENGDYFTVTGRDAKSLLGRRVIWHQTILSGTVEDGIRKLINENVISPTKETRKISNFILGGKLNLTATISQQFTGDNLLDAISSICEAFNLGFKVTLENNNFVFKLYAGTDRTENQTAVPWIVFSSDFDNIANTTYSYDDTNYKNVALVAGEGEGLARKMQAVGDSSGLNRYEIFVDARDLSTNDGEISSADYTAQLIQRGNEGLAETAVVETFEGEIITNYTYTYKTDYFLGDLVTVKNEYGITGDVRIVEIIESEDAQGYKIVPTFDNWKVGSDVWQSSRGITTA